VPEQTYPNGYTIGVFLPVGVPREQADRLLGAITDVVRGDLLADRDGWDPFVFGHAGDLLHVDTDEHVYLSTACHHGNHRYCRENKGLYGLKTPAVCKFCAAPCICTCHLEGDSADGAKIVSSAVEGEEIQHEGDIESG